MKAPRVCKRPGCGKPATVSTQVYCSASCAPFAHLGGVSVQDRIPSTNVASIYSRQVRGEVLAPSLRDARPVESERMKRPPNEPTRSESPKQNERGSTMRPTERDSTSERPRSELTAPSPIYEKPHSHGWNESAVQEKLQGKSGVTGIEGTEKAIAPASVDDATLETQVATSLQPSSDSNAARLTSMNLIDDSAQHLHGLLKSVGTDDPIRLRDPRVISAAATCAKQIHSLIRLKLDVLRELRKK